MRELTEYEKEKWFDGGWFEAPEYILYGHEVGEAYDALVHAEEQGTYLSDEVVVALQIEILTMYYYQFVEVYHEKYYEPEEYGLPSFDSIVNALGPATQMQAWDWAMEWREEHRQQTEDRLLAQRLRKELERLEKRSAS